MATNQEKLKKFMTAIDDYVADQNEKLAREVEQFREEHLRAAEQEVLTVSQKMIRREDEALKLQMSHEVAKRETEARKNLLKERGEILADVFAEAEKQVISFTETADYPALLARMLEGITALMPADGTVFFVREQDLTVTKRILTEKGIRGELLADNAIRFGGIRAENRTAKWAADDTLDARLAEQKQRFIERSGLTVK